MASRTPGPAAGVARPPAAVTGAIRPPDAVTGAIRPSSAAARVAPPPAVATGVARPRVLVTGGGRPPAVVAGADRPPTSPGEVGASLAVAEAEADAAHMTVIEHGMASPAGPAHQRTPATGRRRSWALAGAGAAAVLGLAAVGYGVGPPASQDERELPAGALPPLVSAPAAGHSTGGPDAPAVPGTGPGLGTGTSGPASPLDRSGAPVGGTAAPVPAGTTPAATAAATTEATGPVPPGLVGPPPPADLAPVPEVARVGTIAGDGNLCLDLNGGVPADNNHVQVFDCNGSNAQRWTMAPDGTLQVVGKCAQVTGDTTVHIIGCDSRDEAQWRAGADDTLVNVATNQCLTDPGSGNRSGAEVKVADCTGTDNQQWSLP